MGAYVQLPLAVNNKSERKVDSLPLLGLKPATFGTLNDQQIFIISHGKTISH
jgi:hypothetical protein